MPIITFPQYCEHCTKILAKLGVSHPTCMHLVAYVPYSASNVANLKEIYEKLYSRCMKCRHLPFSMASINASVSLLLIQSINCLCDLSADESSLLKPGIEPGVDITPAFGRALRPSNSKTSKRLTSLIVSSTHLSSPCNALSMASGS